MSVPVGLAAQALSSDGRRRKGQRRREALIDATLRVIERHGVAAISQRVVAREAGLPPSAVTYYFPTADELLVAALTTVNDSYVSRIAAFSADDDRALAEMAVLIERSTRDHRPQLAAEYDLYLLAARRDDMQDELTRWNDTVNGFIARYLTDAAERAGAAAAIDGLFLRSFISRQPPSAAELEAILLRLLRR